MRIFLTGATGYIGHQLALKAVEKGFLISALVRSVPSSNFLQHPNIQFYEGDVTDYSSVVKAMAGCDAVLHAAALTQLWHRDRSAFYQVNVMGTRNVLRAALKHSVQRFVFTSSCAVLGPSNGRPVTEDEPRLTPFENDYEISKYCAEGLVKEYAAQGLHAVIVAPPRVYGPGLFTKGNPINVLVRNTLKRGVAFMPAAKDVVGNYAYIGDVVNGHFLALENGQRGEKYNVGGENISYQTLFNTIALEGKKKLRIVQVPISVLKAWAGIVFVANFLLRRHTHLSPKVVERLVQNRAVSCEKAVRELGYRITPFCEGMAETIRSLESVPERR